MLVVSCRHFHHRPKPRTAPPLPPGVFVVPPANTNGLGYKVYWGPAPATYTNGTDAGTNLQLTLKITNGLPAIYITVVSYYQQTKVESEFAAEIVAVMGTGKTTVTVAWDAPRTPSYITPGMTLDEGTAPTGPWTNVYAWPAFTLTNATPSPRYWRVRATISNTNNINTTKL